jgi:diaminopimelate epimerase
MKLRFTKMQGAGNDFVMLDGIGQRLVLDAATVRRLADRRFGVGADQILVVEASDDPRADFRYRIYNADGGEVEQCGNGARCFVQFVHERGLTAKRSIRVITAGGLIEPRMEADGGVSVDMGVPDFTPQASGFDAIGLPSRRIGAIDAWQIPLDNSRVEVCVVSMGNPHAVQFVEDVSAAPVESVGSMLEKHRRFANGVNAGFAQIVNRSDLRLRVWERGAGETLACGTGACAAVLAGIRAGLLDSPVQVRARGGELRIDWDGGGDAGVRMTGPASKVFEGEIDLP